MIDCETYCDKCGKPVDRPYLQVKMRRMLPNPAGFKEFAEHLRTMDYHEECWADES